MKNVNNQEILSFMQEELNKHNNLKQELITKLGEKANG